MNGRVSQIIAQALFDAGSLLTYVPATGGQDIYNHFCHLSTVDTPLSFHEEVAFTLAHGAALTGRRACAMMKGHGLAKAANSVVDALAAGTTAGLIILILEDPEGKHSDSILNSAPILAGIGVPFRHARKESMREILFCAFADSERLGLPVALIVDSDEMDLEISSPPVTPPPPGRGYVRDITRHILCPAFGAYQYEVLRKKRISQDIDALLRPPIPVIPDTLPDKWKPAIKRYIPLFSIFREFRGDVVAADTGITCLFGCPPFDCVDLTTYMGGSVSLAIGAYLAGHQNVWAVTGDFSFISAGHLGLHEALQRDIPLKVLLFYNGKAETTGGQLIPEGTLERTLAAYVPYTRTIHNPGDPAESRSVLQATAASETLTIVLADCRGH
jgi:TPP-dependent indolepyruvate ferredoxin oxidoreductase alpha subunit